MSDTTTPRVSFHDRYESGNTPWDSGRADHNLVSFLDRFHLKGSAVDMGCGTGSNTRHLAQEGWEALGIDLSRRAIELARELTERPNLSFLVHDMLSGPIPRAPFDLAFDRGCFHVFSSPREQALFAANVAASLREGGYWLSLAASADQESDGSGPPRHRAEELLCAVEPHFEVLRIERAYMDSNRPVKLRIFKLFLQKRG